MLTCFLRGSISAVTTQTCEVVDFVPVSFGLRLLGGVLREGSGRCKMSAT